MAIAATCVWEVRPTNGVDTNSGGFVPGQASPGTDWSQQNAAQYALSGLTSSAANAVILTASAAADMKDNIINVTGGTNATTGHYQIISVVVGVSITVDRNWCTGAVASGTANIGGAKQTIGAMHTILTTANQSAIGQIVYVKAEATITVGATLTFSPNGTASGYASQLIGYTSSRTDNGYVTIQATSGSSYTIFTCSPNSLVVKNFIFDGNSRTGVSGSTCNSGGLQMENCKAINCLGTGITFTSRDSKCVRCIVTASVNGFNCDGGNGHNTFIECIAYSNTGVGFTVQASILIRCISANNSGGSSDGFGGASPMNGNAGDLVVYQCLAYANGRDGFRFGSSIVKPVVFVNNIAWGNSGKDILFVTNQPVAGSVFADYNALVTNTLYPSGAHDVTLTGDPTVAGGSNNFALNNTAGAGAACRAAGFPGVLTVGGTGYADLGPLQHQDTPSTTTVIVAPTINRIITEEIY